MSVDAKIKEKATNNVQSKLTKLAEEKWIWNTYSAEEVIYELLGLYAKDELGIENTTSFVAMLKHGTNRKETLTDLMVEAEINRIENGIVK